MRICILLSIRKKFHKTHSASWLFHRRIASKLEATAVSSVQLHACMPAVSWNQLLVAYTNAQFETTEIIIPELKRTRYDSCRRGLIIALKSSNPINHDKSGRNEKPSRGDDRYLSTHLDRTSNHDSRCVLQ